MKIKLILASGDGDYAEHLSRTLADRFADVFEVGVCSTPARLDELLRAGRYDVALLEPEFAPHVNPEAVRLSVLLCEENGPALQEGAALPAIRKYQRISSIAGAVLERFAQFSIGSAHFGVNRAHITAVWSPGGGTGKTTVALAYAARKAAGGRQVSYLSFEDFSSVSTYFPANGRSISAVFEKLEADVPMLLMAIRQQDSGSGISYFCGPDNYDDMNILTPKDLELLIQSCALNTDQVVVDLSSQCGEKTWKIFDLADTVLLVCDASATAQAKLRQFMGQHNIAQHIREKCILVGNKGAVLRQEDFPNTVQLPLVQSADPVSVYKTLSGSYFEG